MLPPGRRRGHTLSPFMLALGLICLLVSTANAASAVLGLDFGTLNFKAVLVKPGIPFEIVLTKDSKRKEAAAVAFKPTLDSRKNIIAEVGKFPERAYGGDALALQARIPGEVFPNLKPLLGLSLSETVGNPVETYSSRYPAVQAAVEPVLGTITFKSAAFDSEEASWSVEELLAMQLANVKQNAESLAGKGNVVEDVVITVPSFYTADEKRAIQAAAALAGLDVIGLISDGLAVGLDYAKSRTFPDISKGEKAEHHLVYDMGAGSTVATVVRFQARTVKDVGKLNKTIQEVAVLGTGWDRTLGGDSLNNAVLDDYLYKFATKPVMKSRGLDGSDVRKNGRAMSRLWKEAEKSRQVLSANAETTSSLEELLPDIDFRVKLTRSEFEQISLPFADRVAQPIQDALQMAKLEVNDIDTVILHGGAVRTPFVQRKLEEIVGSSAKLRSNVNADESAVFGAAFKGAGLSPSFKVKDIRDSDIAAYPIGMKFKDGDKNRKQVIFGATSPVGNGATTKQVTFKDKEDFAFIMYQQVGDNEHEMSQFQTTNLTAGVKALKDKFGCDKDEVATRLSIKLSPFDGLPVVVGATVSCEVEGVGKAESLGDSVKGWLGLGKKNTESSMDEEEDAGPTEEVDAKTAATSSDTEAAATATGSESSSSSKAAEKPKKRTESIPIAIEVSPRGNPQPTSEQWTRMRARLAAFDRSDRNRFDREEALNVLESFTYYVRDFLTNDDYISVSSVLQRDAISELLSSTREFLEDHAEVVKATESALRGKLKALKDLVDPIKTRRTENLGRSDVLAALKKSVTSGQDLLSKIGDQLTTASSKLAAALESAAATSTTEESTTASQSPAVDDGFADLEVDDTASESASPTTTPAPRPSTLSDFSAYTDDDASRLKDALDSINTWLAEQEEAQASLSPSDDPSLRIADIQSQDNLLKALVRELQAKRLQALPVRTSSKTKAKSKSKKASKSATSTATSVTATDAEGAPVSTEGTATGEEEPVPPTEPELDAVPDDETTDPGHKRDEL